VNSVSFTVSTFILIRVGDVAGDPFGLSSLRTDKPSLISKCPLSDNVEEFTIDNGLITADSLERVCKVREEDCKKLYGLESEDAPDTGSRLLNEVIDELGLLTGAISELDLIDAGEDDAEQYIRDFMQDDSQSDIDKSISAIGSSEDDLFWAIFSYTGWEIGEIHVSEDPDLSHEIEVVFIFDCSLDPGQVAYNLSESAGEEISKESRLSIAEILNAIKSRYGLIN